MSPKRPQEPSATMPPKRQRARKNPPHEAPPERARIMNAEEKRELILAHASSREPDTVQRFSLWAGVGVCVLVIAVGWVYSMRQSIAGAFSSSPVEQTVNEFAAEDKSENLQQNLDALMEHLNTVQAKSSAELQAFKAVSEQVQAVASSSAAREDLFKPADANSKSSTKLPSGVTIENY